MARGKHAFAKRQREIAKKKKADEKRARRQMKKEAGDAPPDEPLPMPLVPDAMPPDASEEAGATTPDAPEEAGTTTPDAPEEAGGALPEQADGDTPRATG